MVLKNRNNFLADIFDETQAGKTTPDQSESGSNDNEGFGLI